MKQMGATAESMEHPVLSRWVKAILEHDTETLMEIYSDSAVVRAFSEELHGLKEIADHLRVHRKAWQRLCLDELVPQTVDDGRVCFETAVRSLWGAKVVRHAWTLADQRIACHEMQLVRA